MFTFSYAKLVKLILIIALLSVSNLSILISTARTFEPAKKTLLNKSTKEIAETGRIVFRFFDDSHGIPQNTINTVTTDKKGYIWVGTQDGAAYYNGQSWLSVNMPNRTLSNWVYQIYIAKDGSVLFCTNGAGLSSYKDGIWKTYDTKSGLPNDQVRSVLETTNLNGKEVLWIGTSNGLARFEEGKWTVYTTSSGLPNNVIRHLIETTDNNGKKAIWVGTDGGLARFEEEKWTVYTTSSGLPNNVIRGLSKSQSSIGHSLWVGTEGGVGHFDNGTWTIYQDKDGLASNEVRCVLETTSAEGEPILWVGTGGFGLSRFEKGHWITYTTKSGLPDDSVWSLLETTSTAGIRTLWIGMASRGGLAKLETGKWISFNTESGLPNNAVFSIMESKNSEDSSSFWIGTDGGLGYWENGTWTIYNVKSGLPNNTVRALLETRETDGRKIIWIATEGGLVKIDKGVWRVFDVNSGLPSNRIYCLLSTINLKGELVLWAGTREGLARFENGIWHNYNITNSKLPNNIVRSLAITYDKDGKEKIWIGTESGLACLKSGEWLANNLPDQRIRTLLKVKDVNKDWLWVGTDGGVFWTEIKDSFSDWQWLSDSTTPAIPNNTIYQVMSDKESRIYLSTNKGVVRLTKINPNKATRDNYSIYNFTIKDGLPNNECNSGASLVDSLGRIWVGTIGGAALFDPSKETLDNVSKPFYLEKLLVAGKAQKFDSLTTDLGNLSYNQNNISFEYALLSYFRESDSRYRFQLIGYDKTLSEWTNEPKKEYQNLSSGEYIFNVWAKDYLGNISGPIIVKFYIKPAPWHSWGAYLFYLIVISTIIYQLHNYQLKRLAKQNMLLEAKVAERTDQLGQTNKELFVALEQIKVSQKQTEEKNQELLLKNLELDKKNAELADKNVELIESHKRADRIFSALAQALPGTVLDEKYKLEEKIGSGGFGAVYRATHLSLKKAVAIKIFRPAPGNDSVEALERFQLEAISSCRINHPNSVAILDSGTSEDGIAYLVMELLKGETLKGEIVRKRRIPLKRTIEILLPVCEVLEVAHQAGVVHRDIKPDNIFLHKDEKCEIIKVVDFGIAKIVDMIDISGNLTNTGGLIGTPAYMSPERLTSQLYDGRSDVYSLGVTFYQMLSGHLPFSTQENNLSTIILKHLTETPPSLEKFNVRVPKTIHEIILKMLEKDQNERPTAQEVAQVLKSVLETLIDSSEDTSVFLSELDDDTPTISRSIPSIEGANPSIEKAN